MITLANLLSQAFALERLGTDDDHGEATQWLFQKLDCGGSRVLRLPF